MSELGDLLKRLRGKMSLREAGKKTGISHTYLSIIENGYDLRSGKPVKPTPETLKLLSEAYDYPYTDLMRAAGYIDDIGSTDNPARKDDQNTHHESIDPEWVELYEIAKQKGMKLEATALLRSISGVSKNQLRDIIKVLDMIERDDY